MGTGFQNLSEHDMMNALIEAVSRVNAMVTIPQVQDVLIEMTGYDCGPNTVRSKLQRMSTGGSVDMKVINTLKRQPAYFVAPAGKDYDIPAGAHGLVIVGPIRKEEVMIARKNTNIGEIFHLQKKELEVDGSVEVKVIKARVAQRTPWLCVFDNGVTVPWWQMALFYRRISKNRVINMN